MKKYDIVTIIDFYNDKDDEEYMDIGKKFIGENAMIIGFYNGEPSKFDSEYDIEICFFNQELQELAMEYGFDWWDKTELELLGGK